MIGPCWPANRNPGKRRELPGRWRPEETRSYVRATPSINPLIVWAALLTAARAAGLNPIPARAAATCRSTHVNRVRARSGRTLLRTSRLCGAERSQSSRTDTSRPVKRLQCLHQNHPLPLCQAIGCTDRLVTSVSTSRFRSFTKPAATIHTSTAHSSNGSSRWWPKTCRKHGSGW